MTERKYKPVRHDHAAFLENAKARKGFTEEYEALALEYELANQLLRARARAGLTQDAVAERMGTTKSAISRLEAAGKHTPSLGTLKRYAQAVGCELRVRLVPRPGIHRPASPPADGGLARVHPAGARLRTPTTRTPTRTRPAPGRR